MLMNVIWEYMIAWLEQLVEIEMVATLVNVQAGTEEMEDGLGLDKGVQVHIYCMIIETKFINLLVLK